LDPSPRPEFRVANLALIAFAFLRGSFQRASWKVIKLDVETIVLAKRTDHRSVQLRDDSSQLAILIKGNLQSNDAITSNKLS